MNINKDINILLCTPTFDLKKLRAGESLGIRYIASYLIHKGFSNVEVSEPSLENSNISSFVSKISKEKYHLIGMGILYDGLAENAIDTIKEIKRQIIDVHICVGGHFPTFNFKELLNEVFEIDSVSVGYSEETFYQLSLALSENKPINSISNLYTRNSINFSVNQFYYKTTSNDIPFPVRTPSGNWNYGGHYTMVTSRGCPYQCSFCSAPSFCNYKDFIPRTPENVANEIENLCKNYSAKSISFLDSCFLGYDEKGKQRALEIAQRMNRINSELSWSMECRTANVTRKFFRDLQLYGLKHVFIGIESFIPRKLKLFKKGANPQQNEFAIKLLDEMGITFYFGFIMFEPYISKEEILIETETLAKLGILTYKSLISVLKPYRGTEIFQILLKNNLLIREGWSYRIRFQNLDIYEVLEKLKYIFEPIKAFDIELYKILYSIQNNSRMSNLGILREISMDNSNELIPYVHEVIKDSNCLEKKRVDNIRNQVKFIISKNYNKLESIKNVASSISN